MNDLLAAEQKRESILRMEAALRDLPQLEIKLEHYFADGLVAREAFLPKDSYVTGHIHLREHLVIIPYGEVTVVTETETRTYKGYCSFVGNPGSKRAVYAHEDTVWIAVNACSAKTPEDAERENVVTSYEDLLGHQEVEKCLT